MRTRFLSKLQLYTRVFMRNTHCARHRREDIFLAIIAVCNRVTRMATFISKLSAAFRYARPVVPREMQSCTFLPCHVINQILNLDEYNINPDA